MYTLHIANKNYSSWSLRPWLLMKALQIPFHEQLVTFDEQGNYERFRGFSPTGQVPCLHDLDLVVWDSLAIIEYLAEQHAEVWPAEKAQRAWARCAAAEMHAGFSALREECSMNVGVRYQLKAPSRALLRNLGRLDELWQEGLSRFGGPFLAGDRFTAVDAMYAPVVYRLRSYGLSLSEASMRYVERMLAHPAMRAWEEAALAEAWREVGHDEACLQYANMLEDHRAVS